MTQIRNLLVSCCFLCLACACHGAAATVADADAAGDTQVEGFGDSVAIDQSSGDIDGGSTSGSDDLIATDTGLDATLVPVADGCVASCQTATGVAKICGSNGCGSVCGFCTTGHVCTPDGTACQEVCKPKCDNKKCGDDGCGGNCGSCPGNYSCGLDFLCHAADCVPSCAGKSCGDDGCGKTCGDCGTGDYCSGGQCVALPCKGVDPKGQCAGDILVSCQGSGPSGSKQQIDCAAKPGKTCGWNAVTSLFDCIDKPPCQPSCKTAEGKAIVCGDNGCGSPCGACTEGWTCKVTVCQPQAGAICGPSFPPAGQCQGDVWMFCNTGKIATINCADSGYKCGWSGTKFACL